MRSTYSFGIESSSVSAVATRVGAEAPARRGGAGAAAGPRSARRRRTAGQTGRWPRSPSDRTPARGERGGQLQPNGRILDEYRTNGTNGQGRSICTRVGRLRGRAGGPCCRAANAPAESPTGKLRG